MYHAIKFLPCILAACVLLLVAPRDDLHAQECSACFQCDPENSVGVPGSTILWLPNQSCAYGDCENALPCDACGEGEQCDDEDGDADGDIDRLAELLEQSDALALVKFVRSSAKRLEFVPKRNAVAVRGCSDQLIALLPVPEHHTLPVALALSGLQGEFYAAREHLAETRSPFYMGTFLADRASPLN